ncbi:chemotaxis protein CheW [Candidatus Methylospira mobilis]|uniref:Chemotaxis protein CheW n=1 Tax=Candidatus Methylospira mobilis TaxID=1808979 RepID=A0A5Q0BEZ7_9GAMM|nr:chemotaxis protein CheW [Candidatus Methylospira mobilis]QFY42445.1 chemotaxis protein CheW [Candidatus Methylospira mobilis]WNV04451.1 chemotaxis protein CheW [Candidatus Methylospira mobilis]
MTEIAANTATQASVWGVGERYAGEAGTRMEYLAFMVGGEEYGVNILKVQEIRGYESVTRIPNAPEFVKGVINLRGVIVPIVDLRIKFQLGTPTYDQLTVVIILNLDERISGVVVDSVSDVTTLMPEQVRAAPDFGSSINTQYIIGLGAVDDRMLILLDIGRLMTSEEMALTDSYNEVPTPV